MKKLIIPMLGKGLRLFKKLGRNSTTLVSIAFTEVLERHQSNGPARQSRSVMPWELKKNDDDDFLLFYSYYEYINQLTIY